MQYSGWLAGRRPAQACGAGTGCSRLGCHTILYHTILYHTILYHTMPYYTIPYYTILYYTRALVAGSQMGGRDGRV